MMNVYHVESQFQGAFHTNRRTTRYIVVHHAAMVYASYGIDVVKQIDYYHRVIKGWGGIGYHEIIVMNAQKQLECYVLSDPMLQRAHVAYRNHEAFGICCATNFDAFPNKMPNDAWMNALVERLRAAKDRWPNAEIVGHREIALPGWGTSCPGSRWYDWKGTLLARVDMIPDQHIKWWRVGPTGARVFTAPSVWSPVAWDGKCVLPPNFPPFQGRIVKGTAYKGIDWYVHLITGDGFVWGGSVSPATPT